jgi:hypothetical protein
LRIDRFERCAEHRGTPTVAAMQRAGEEISRMPKCCGSQAPITPCEPISTNR